MVIIYRLEMINVKLDETKARLITIANRGDILAKFVYLTDEVTLEHVKTGALDV
jgi:hypothetical protein